VPIPALPIVIEMTVLGLPKTNMNITYHARTRFTILAGDVLCNLLHTIRLHQESTTRSSPLCQIISIPARCVVGVIYRVGALFSTDVTKILASRSRGRILGQRALEHRNW
jgi:hypothetical protein